MPQLDILIFSLQISIIFFLGWSLYFLISTVILSQYLSYNLFKKLSWLNITSLINFIKLASTLSLLNLLNFSSKMLKLIAIFLNVIKLLTLGYSKTVSKKILLKSNLYFIKSFFSNLIYSENNFGQKYNLNFLILKNSNYIFVQNYFQNKLNLRKKTTKIMIKNTRKYRLDEDETIIHNLLTLNSQVNKLNSIYKK